MGTSLARVTLHNRTFLMCYNAVMAQNAVAYYRVSTKRQGKSGLGLEAQMAAVDERVAADGLNLVGAFTEVETGTAKRTRPQLEEALELCRAHAATLVIAKLDRLARNVHFLTGLMESGVRFVACDMPEADSFTVHILAAVAQREAELISERTKAALTAAKRRGVKLGNPSGFAPGVQQKGVNARQSSAASYYRGIVLDHICALRDSGQSYRAIAERLNSAGQRTRNGKAWNPVQVRRVYERYCTSTH